MTIKTTAIAAATLALLAPLAANAQITTVTGSGPYCREFTQTVTIAGRTQQGWGTACLQPDGSWQIQPNTLPADANTAAAPQPGVQYVVEDQNVYLVPPEPFVTGSIFIEGSTRRFDDDFRPHRGNWGWGPSHRWEQIGPRGGNHGGPGDWHH